VGFGDLATTVPKVDEMQSTKPYRGEPDHEARTYGYKYSVCPHLLRKRLIWKRRHGIADWLSKHLTIGIY